MSAMKKFSAGALIVLAMLAAVPLVITNEYFYFAGYVVLQFVVLATAWNILGGFAGYVNFGSAAFFAIGAYVTTVLVKSFGWNFWGAALIAVVCAGLVGLLLAAFSVRLKGHYLGIASLGFAVIAYQVLLNWESVTEGVRGIYGIMPPSPIRIPGLPEIAFGNPVALFWLVGGLALFVYIVVDNLIRSPVGETLRAIREDEVSAASLEIGRAHV